MTSRKQAQQVSPATLPDSVEGWAGLIAALQDDKVRVAREVAQLDAERRPIALGAVTGDRAAQDAVTRLNAQAGELHGALRTLEDALVDATRRHGAAVQRDRAAAQAARLAQLQDAARAQLALAREVDGAACVLAEAMAAYDAGLQRMAEHGAEANVRNKLFNRTMRASALHAAGLSGALPLPPVGPSFRMPLARWTGKIVGVLAGVAQADAEPGPEHVVEIVAVMHDAPPVLDPAALSPEEEMAEDRLAQRLLRGAAA